MIFSDLLDKKRHEVMEPIMEYFKHDQKAKCTFINSKKPRDLLNKSTNVQRDYQTNIQYY